jgi:hypothetical protein
MILRPLERDTDVLAFYNENVLQFFKGGLIYARCFQFFSCFFKGVLIHSRCFQFHII